MNVLVCDDIQERCEEAVNRVHQARRDCRSLVGKDLTDALAGLLETVKKSVEDPEGYSSGHNSEFDTADIVILDNNLTHLPKPDAPLVTAESIAGYVRAFTKAGYIVSLNLNLDVDFDLRYLVGDHSTKADVALNTRHLSNPALWSGDPAVAQEGFLPWYWPRLDSAAQKRARQIEFVSTKLDEPILGALGFGEQEIELLSPHARGALSPEAAWDGEVAKGGIPLEKVTFRNFFHATGRSLSFKPEREKLSKAEEEGTVALRDVIARVVAADMDLWFRRDIVAPQEPLVDIPHLLMRLPFLLGERAKNIADWNESAVANTPPYGFESRLYDEHVAGTKFEHDVWLPNTCFRWPRLKADEKLNEYFFQAKEGDWADAVFCEDCSKFLDRSPKDGGGPTEFPAEFEGPWQRRHIARIDGYRYAPRSRLAI